MRNFSDSRYMLQQVRVLIITIYLLGIHGCASQSQYAPWLEVTDEKVSTDGAVSLPSIKAFRGGKAPTKGQVGVPRYPGSSLFRTESFVSPTIGTFKEVCPNRRGLILVTKHEIGRVEAWYRDNLPNSLVLSTNQSIKPIVWGEYAQHNWSHEEASNVAMRAPYIGLSEIKGTALEQVVPSYSTAIDVMYCAE